MVGGASDSLVPLPVLFGTDAGFALSLSLLVSAAYFAVVRAMDLNEKEPLWAMSLVFLLGAVAAGLLRGIVGSEDLELSVWKGALAEEVAKFLALAAGLAILGGWSRWRGWAEVGGLMDGVVYGTAAGLGFAAGSSFLRELAVDRALLEDLAGPGGLDAFWSSALYGLSHGLFGAVLGAGFAAAAHSSGRRRWVTPLGALAFAMVFHAAHALLGRGAALGDAGEVRKWVALLIPVAFVVGVMVMALARERRALAEQLSGETEAGTVTSDEVALLRSLVRRRLRYLRRFLARDFDGWLALRTLHNRQVQLALAKQRVRAQPDAAMEVERLRAAVADARADFERVRDDRGTEVGG